MNSPILTVSQLNRFVKSLIEGDRRLSDLLLQGEISNLHLQQSSGHMYFTLKDSAAAVRAVMFRNNARLLPFTPQNGMAVILRCSVSLYERDGAYQIYVNDMQPDGVGSLHLAFEQLKNRLTQEGLFDPAHKKPIPSFPDRIGVITSPEGAALQDILNILSRRYPLATVVLCPVLVQGEQAAGQLIQAVKRMDEAGHCDVLIIGRGGGSLEDLWAFNNEDLARAIFSCSTPVISAVGHETDFTICDFVADLRAPTPSASAELAVPNQRDLRYTLLSLQEQMQVGMERRLQDFRDRLARCDRENLLDLQQRRLRMHRQQLRLLVELVRKAEQSLIPRRREKLAALSAVMDALSPLHTLGRGYALLLREDEPITRAVQLSPGETITVRLSDGRLRAQVLSVEQRDEGKNQL